MDFVDIDSCLDGNPPAMSKSELYKYWPPFLVARDLGCMNFYRKYIPYFELRAASLRDFAKLKMTASVIELFTSDHAAAYKDLIGALVSDTCLARHNPTKRPYLLTDFTKFGFGY